MITIIDYDRGNLFSLGQAVHHLGGEFEISENPGRVKYAEKLLLPGVGAFGDGMARLRQKGLADAILQAAERGTPILGICLGMQLLATVGEEFGNHKGLGLIPGVVRRLPQNNTNDSQPSRIPNIGWRKLIPSSSGTEDFEAGSMVYFLHSYALETENPSHTTATIIFNEQNVPAAVRHENLIGYQFHPEKSGPVGLSLIRRFIESPRT
jgi:imidazole glycerol-phosphate synthase subunit HisH